MMHDHRHRWRRRLTWTTTVMAITVMALSGVAVAGSAFTDVPDAHTFHDDITWMKNNDVTRGCNPPDNDQYCPGDNVLRGEMAAFMRRNAGASGNVGTFESDGVSTSPGGTGLAKLTVPARHGATVVLNASMTISRPSTDVTDLHIFVIRDSCSGPVVGVVRFTRASGTATPDVVPVSVTGMDTTTGPTDYWLCAVTPTGNATASHRSLTASWSPTS